MIQATSGPQARSEPLFTSRLVERYRDAIERYAVDPSYFAGRRWQRAALIDRLTEATRPLLEAILEADLAGDDVVTLEREIRNQNGSHRTVLSKLELVRARERRRIALATLREALRDEQALMRYTVLRELVRSERVGSAGTPA